MRASKIFFGMLVATIMIFGSLAMSLNPTPTSPSHIANLALKSAYGYASPCTGPCKLGGSITNVIVKPTSGHAPLLVSFSISFNGTMQSITWHYGDQSPDVTNVQSTSHTYQSAGNYTGSVEVVFSDRTDQSQIFSVSVSGTIGGTATGTNVANRTGTAYQYLQQEHQNPIVATAQPPLSIATNSPSYGQGDSIIIHGAVKDISNATAVTLRVVNPIKNLVSVAQLIPNADGSFSKTILATGPLWTTAGNYTAIAQYGPYTNASTKFYFTGGNGQPTLNKLLNGTYALQGGQIMYNVPWTIQGGTIQNMQVIPTQSSLVITISSTSDGSFTIDLPRALIDSKQPPPPASGVNQTVTTQYNQAELPDQPFIVQIGGQNVKHSETNTANSRTLGIPFHKGDTTIYIVGTIAVPEFGPIAVLVLAIAIISIIAVSAKTGLRFMPKFHGLF